MCHLESHVWQCGSRLWPGETCASSGVHPSEYHLSFCPPSPATHGSTRLVSGRKRGLAPSPKASSLLRACFLLRKAGGHETLWNVTSPTPPTPLSPRVLLQTLHSAPRPTAGKEHQAVTWHCSPGNALRSVRLPHLTPELIERTRHPDMTSPTLRDTKDLKGYQRRDMSAQVTTSWLPSAHAPSLIKLAITSCLNSSKFQCSRLCPFSQPMNCLAAGASP